MSVLYRPDSGISVRQRRRTSLTLPTDMGTRPVTDPSGPKRIQRPVRERRVVLACLADVVSIQRDRRDKNHFNRWTLDFAQRSRSGMNRTDKEIPFYIANT
jgi:hypothetical protein